MSYAEKDYLMISGIQHFVFCKRQWALDHIEKQWSDNYLTISGNRLHEKVDDPYLKESRGTKFIVRAMPIHSREFGLTGICDAVEFQKSSKGVKVFGREDTYLPIPVEYKHGKSKMDDSDRLQLLAEGICLEEMLFCKLGYGYLYYGRTKHREKVEFTQDLRGKLQDVLNEMHSYWKRKYTPKVKPSKKCKSCSLRNICLPELMHEESVSDYISRRIKE